MSMPKLKVKRRKVKVKVRKKTTLSRLIKKPCLRSELISESEQGKKERLVSYLVCHTAALELVKNEYVELAPLGGICGSFRLYGNFLPVFEYRVFDVRKNPIMMEFIKVRVEISKPSSIRYICTIDSKETEDPLRHNETVEVLQKYKDPFEKLCTHLSQYFPFWRNSLYDRCPDRRDGPKLVTEQNENKHQVQTKEIKIG